MLAGARYKCVIPDIEQLFLPHPLTLSLNMITHQQSLALVLKRLQHLGKELDKAELQNAQETTRLFGDGSHLDSMGLVTLIADLEEDIYHECGARVTLADEKAMSRLTSPFRRVNLLADYIHEVVNAC
jgi:acyl carrier protein